MNLLPVRCVEFLITYIFMVKSNTLLLARKSLWHTIILN